MERLLTHTLIGAAAFAAGLAAALVVADGQTDLTYRSGAPQPAAMVERSVGDTVSRQWGDIPDLLVTADQTTPVELVFNRTDQWGDIPDMTVVAFADARGRIASANAQTSPASEAKGKG